MDLNPEIWALSRVEWQLFGGVSWKSESLPESVRLAVWFAALRSLASILRIHFKSLLWVLRVERGEKFCRLHNHFLLGGLPSSLVTKRTCAVFEQLLRNAGAGISPTRIFDMRRAGVEYLMECLSGADVYESGKFGTCGASLDGESSKFGTSGLMISESTTNLLRKLVGVGELAGERPCQRARGQVCKAGELNDALVNEWKQWRSQLAAQGLPNPLRTAFTSEV